MTSPTAAADVLLGAVARHVAALASAGVHLVEPVGAVEVDGGGRGIAIGSVVVLDDGTVYAVPCADATAEQIFAVLRDAELVKLDGAHGPRWRRVAELGAVRSVFEPIGAAP
ncbi:hypothetical protein [Nocardia sp. NRRL WC-3656]|uniref:hypothetical protein n=1 Tax=Nocardia sp. NRRL WC-3656 TaxID=1463824 RepID=UPI0012DE4ADF|nr:hypothetical protein [Nocardia sp. NRRL WC-3656]